MKLSPRDQRPLAESACAAIGQGSNNIRRMEDWHALDDARRGRLLVAIQTQATSCAEADRDRYASNFTDIPSVEILDSVKNFEGLTVGYLFHWWERCPAQSGSDWSYHCVYYGTATFVDDSLAGNDFERLRRSYVHEYDEENYDRDAVLREIRLMLAQRPALRSRGK